MHHGQWTMDIDLIRASPVASYHFWWIRSILTGSELQLSTIQHSSYFKNCFKSICIRKFLCWSKLLNRKMLFLRAIPVAIGSEVRSGCSQNFLIRQKRPEPDPQNCLQHTRLFLRILLRGILIHTCSLLLMFKSSNDIFIKQCIPELPMRPYAGVRCPHFSFDIKKIMDQKKG
jgi:hypothetical protein